MLVCTQFIASLLRGPVATKEPLVLGCLAVHSCPCVRIPPPWRKRERTRRVVLSWAFVVYSFTHSLISIHPPIHPSIQPSNPPTLHRLLQWSAQRWHSCCSWSVGFLFLAFSVITCICTRRHRGGRHTVTSRPPCSPLLHPASILSRPRLVYHKLDHGCYGLPPNQHTPLCPLPGLT